MTDLVLVNPPGLTPAQFGELSDVPPEIEWLANITNVKTRRAYKEDVSEFFAFAGLKGPRDSEALARLHLDRPTSLSDRLYAALVGGALKR